MEGVFAGCASSPWLGGQFFEANDAFFDFVGDEVDAGAGAGTYLCLGVIFIVMVGHCVVGFGLKRFEVCV